MGGQLIKTDFISSERDGEMILRFTLAPGMQASVAEIIEAILCNGTVRRVYEEV